MSFPTPNYQITPAQAKTVYYPAEDSFLLMDAIEKDIEDIRSRHPQIVLEIGVGSGVISTFIAKALSSMEGGRNAVICLGTDLNEDACQATTTTSRMNETEVDVVRTDLVRSLLPRLESRVDVLLFNPPYVPTEHEAASNLELCWAGGCAGTSTLRRLLPDVPRLLSPQGVFYMVALQVNDIPALLKHNEKLLGSVVMERRAGIEHLYVLKFHHAI